MSMTWCTGCGRWRMRKRSSVSATRWQTRSWSSLTGNTVTRPRRPTAMNWAQRQLDVVLVHRLVLEKGLGIAAQAVATEKNITYEREMDAAIAGVDRGQAQLCCLLNPVRVEQVAKIALGGEVLPQKSTDFYPKLLSGLTIYCMDE